MANPYPYTFYTAKVGRHKKIFKTLKDAENFVSIERYVQRRFSGQVARYCILVTEYPYNYRIPINVEFARLEQKFYSKIEDADWYELCKDYLYNARTRSFANYMIMSELNIISYINSIEAYKNQVYYNPFVEVRGTNNALSGKRGNEGECPEDIKNQKIPVGFMPISFASMDEAGKFAVNYINSQSIRDDLEYGGRIYKSGNRFYITHPHKGCRGETGPLPESYMSNNLVGWYHTHGYSNKKIDQTFSGYDIEQSNANKITGYLGISQRRNIVQKYIPVNPPLVEKYGKEIDSNYIELLKKMGYLSDVE